MTQTTVTMAHLVAAVLRGDWDFFDANISAALNPNGYAWAVRRLGDANPDIEDMAASIIEKSKGPLREDVRNTLLVRLKAASSMYAQFRIACALWNHGDRSSEVRTVLEKRAKDEDAKVGKIAETYLRQA